jgi:hypothetical protein
MEDGGEVEGGVVERQARPVQKGCRREKQRIITRNRRRHRVRMSQVSAFSGVAGVREQFKTVWRGQSDTPIPAAGAAWTGGAGGATRGGRP